MLDAVRAGGIVLIMAASAGWYAYDLAGASQSRDDDVSVYQRGGGGGTGGGGGRGRHRLSGPVAVITTPVVRKDVPVHVDGIGTVQAFNTVTVRAQVDGQLEKVTFTEGQDVEAGDVLAQIDQRRYQAKLTQAQGMKAKDEAQLANVKLDLERFVRLGQFATQQSVDTQRALVRQLEAALQVDQANIDAAALELDYTTIRAPISGRTSVRLIDAGNYVRAGEASGIVVVTQLQPISVAFSLPQQHLVTVNQAMPKARSRWPHSTRAGRRCGKRARSRSWTTASTSRPAPSGLRPPSPIPSASCGRGNSSTFVSASILTGTETPCRPPPSSATAAEHSPMLWIRKTGSNCARSASARSTAASHLSNPASSRGRRS